MSTFNSNLPRLRLGLRLRLRARAAACASMCALPWALAQAQQTVVITGNPLGRASETAPASVLSGDALVQRRAGTLGETLDGLPGVSATGFGPNSSRPVIRGLDGDRIRLLDNGGASVDASSLSFDHASATDPLVVERIEVLRGPAALLYGGNATGGVVNSIDNRIPRLPAAGFGGRAEVRFGGAAHERSAAAVLEGGGDRMGDVKNGAGALAWHLDASYRDAGDLRVPRFTPVEDGLALDPTVRVRNSASRSQGAALGAGWVSDRGHLGAAVETTRKRYGVTVEPEVSIRMQRDRLAVDGDWRQLPGAISRLSAQASHSRYEHEEVESSGKVGTTFKSRGDDMRLEAHHAPITLSAGVVRGVFGLQAESMDFSALGEEAFVPATRTRSAAAFALEELVTGAASFSAGLRLERVRVASRGDANAADDRFGAAVERRFTPLSASISARFGAAEGWQASATLGHTERAPAYYELHANGVHVATSTYERGDAALPLERSRHAEIGLGWTGGPHSLKANLFETRFSRYLSLDASGRQIVIPGSGGEADREVPEYAFRAVRARMRGFEIEGRTRLVQSGDGGFGLELTSGLDAVRGDNLDAGEPLPRLAPRRLRAGLEATLDGWRGGLGVRQIARQSRVPATDTATPGTTLLDVWLSGRLAAVNGALWFARLNNATDRLATSATTIATMRGLAPLPGRALTVGVQARF